MLGKGLMKPWYFSRLYHYVE